MNGVTFVERIRKELDKKDISQYQLAKAVGITKTSFSHWEQRGNIPSADIVLRIANFLGVSMEYLITGEETGSATMKEIEKLPERRLKDLTLVEIEQEKLLKDYDENLLLGNYRLLNENNKKVILSIMNTLLLNQE